MKGTVIFGEVILLFHNIFVIAHKFDINEATVQVWEVQNESPDILKVDFSDPNINYTIPFGANRTFILLKIQHPQWSIFFWLGSQTTVEQKMKAASLAGELWYQIVKYPNKELIENLTEYNISEGLWYKLNKTPKSKIINPLEQSSKKKESAYLVSNSPKERIIPTINRETEYMESHFFRAQFEAYGEHLQYQEMKMPADLYEISYKKKKIYIELIPLNSEINENDNVYVLDEENSIKYSGEKTIDILESTNISLVYNLINEKLSYGITIDYMKINESIHHYIRNAGIINQESVRNKINSASVLISDLADKFEKFCSITVLESVNNKEAYTILHRPLIHNISQYQQKKKIVLYLENENFLCCVTFTATERYERDEANKVLYKVTSTINVYTVDPVKNMKMQQITENAVYIIENSFARTLNVYIGTESYLDEIRYALIYAENVYDRCKFEKIIFAAETNVFTLNENLKQPTAFWVNFEDYTNFLFPLKRSTNDFSNDLLTSLEYGY